MINLVDWSQAIGLLYFLVAIIILLPIGGLICLVSMTLKNKKKKQQDS
jgi:heme/copper-type cytochrome/quinol oxidase subunit 1